MGKGIGEERREPIPFHLSSGHFSLSLFPPFPHFPWRLWLPGRRNSSNWQNWRAEPGEGKHLGLANLAPARGGEREKVEKDRFSEGRRKKLSSEKKEGHDHDLSVNREEKEEEGGKERGGGRKWKGKRKSSLSPFPAPTNGLWKWRAGIFFVGDVGE